MRAEDRRELVLAEATRIFGSYGYVGATTHQVAEAAGVSQPYIVKMFGTKENLFLEVLGRALDCLMTAFRAEVADETSTQPLGARLGLAYVNLVSQTGMLLSLMHGFVLGADPCIGPVARAGFMTVYRFLREEGGFSPEESHAFLADGMLMNTMIGLRMTDDYGTDASVDELLTTTFPNKLELIRSKADPAPSGGATSPAAGAPADGTPDTA